MNLGFEKHIQTHIKDLLESLHDVSTNESSMKLPEDLTRIFENLEFTSNDIPLSRRGDGIKIRYIPKILQFIAEKENSKLGTGIAKYFHVWGFEEPENNVEMSSAFDMVNQLLEMLSESDRFQIFLTTHSPIFYGMNDPGLEDNNPWITRYFVKKEKYDSIIELKDREHVDQSMGLMPLVAPYIEEAKAKFDTLTIEQEQLRSIAEKRCPTIFLEGRTDLDVLKCVLKLNAPDFFKSIHLHVGNFGEYGSANALSSRALAWVLEMRHRPDRDRVLALALFDSDSAGDKAQQDLKSNIQKLDIQHVKKMMVTAKIPPSGTIQSLKEKGFQLPCDLESLYTDFLWAHAEECDWLIDCKTPQDRFSSELIKRMVTEKEDPQSNLNDHEMRRVFKQFSDTGKLKAAKYIVNLKGKKVKEQLVNFDGLVTSIQALLTPK